MKCVVQSWVLLYKPVQIDSQASGEPWDRRECLTQFAVLQRIQLASVGRHEQDSNSDRLK